jgi:phosphatidylglycerophosphate synthase
MKIHALIPSAISSLRIVALPIFLYFFSINAIPLCFIVLALSAGTDLLDGFVARKLKVASKLGAYYDAVTDFILITGIFTVFTLSNYYSAWVLLLIAASFTQFILSSFYAKKLYDPVGKYLGSVLYIGITLTLILPTALVFSVVEVGFLAFALTSFVSRTLSFVGIQKKNILIKANIKHPKTHSSN